MPESPRRGSVIAAFGAVYFIWGSTYLAISICIETWPPFLFAALWALVPGALLFAWTRRQNRPTGAHWRAALISGFLLSGTGIGVVAWGQKEVPSSVAALLFGTVPLWTVVLEWALGRRPAGRIWAGLGLGVAGLGLLVGPEFVEAWGATRMWRILVVLAGALSWAAGSIYAKRAELPAALGLTVGMQMLCGGAALLVFSGWIGEWPQLGKTTLSSRSLWALGYLMVFDSILAYSAFIWLLRTVGPARTATFAFVNPVVAVLLGWAVANEPVTGRMLVAGAAIVGAVVLITRESRHE
jgi:drug/metabolite transporter (DMT)-like permease